MFLKNLVCATAVLLAAGSVVSASRVGDLATPLQSRSPQVLAWAAVPDRKAPEEAAPVHPPDALEGRYLMTLPAGFQYKIMLVSIAKGLYRLENAVRFSGVYELRGKRLVLIHAQGRGEHGFEWEVGKNGQVTLVAQPPVQKLGQDYRGASLIKAAR